MANKILGVNDMADDLGVSPNRVRQLIRENRIEGVELVSNTWVILREDFEKFKSIKRKSGRPKRQDSAENSAQLTHG